MKLLLFAFMEEDRKRLQKYIFGLKRDLNCDIMGTLDELADRLRYSKGAYSLSIILVTSQEEFDSILFIDRLFKGLSTIIVRPNWEKKTASGALMFHPEYISHSLNDLSDVSLVTDHMLKKTNR